MWVRLRICTTLPKLREPLGENKWVLSFTAGPEVFEMFCAFTIFVVVFVILVRSAIRVLLSVRLFVRWINFCFARVRKENHFSLKTSQPLLCFYIPFTTQARASFLRWDLPSTQSPKGNFAKWEEFWNFNLRNRLLVVVWTKTVWKRSFSNTLRRIMSWFPWSMHMEFLNLSDVTRAENIWCVYRVKLQFSNL